MSNLVFIRGYHEIHDVIEETLSAHGKITSVRLVKGEDNVTDIEYEFENSDDAEEINSLLRRGSIIVDDDVLCSRDSYDEPCTCPYGERWGHKGGESCEGERCRRASHKDNCPYRTCTGCSMKF